MPDQIFISYRRNDAAYVTGHINDRLRKEFGDASVFTDVDSLALGVDFRTVLDETIGKCHILLAVIGENWIGARNQDGQLRLHEPTDFVRIEIETALKRDIPVIPLLIAGTKMPVEEELPDSLRDLAFRNGIPIRPAPDFHTDMERLIQNLRQHLRAAQIKDGSERLTPPIAGGRRNGDPVREAGEQQPGLSALKIKVDEEEQTRKQIELGTGPSSKKKRGVARTILTLIGLLVVAGAAGFAVLEYQKQVDATNAALAAIQKEAAEAEARREADAIAAAERQAEADAATRLQAEADAAAELLIEADDAAAELQVDADAELPPDADATIQAVTDATLQAEADAAARLEANAIAAAERQAASDAEAKRNVDAASLLREGVSLAGYGNYEAAIHNYDEAIRLNVQPAFAYKQRGAANHSLENYAEAISDYGDAILLRPGDANAYYNRSAAHRALQDHESAIADCDEAIRIDPEFVNAYISRSASHEALGNLEAAARDRTTAEELQSRRNKAR